MKKILDKIKVSFSRNKNYLLIFVVLWAVFVFFTLNHFSNTLGRESDGPDVASEVVEMNENTELVQIMDIDEGTKTVSIKYATYARKNKGDVFVKIEGVTSKKIYVDEKTRINNIQDNAYITYTLNEELIDEKVKISLSSSSLEGKGAAVYVVNEAYFGNSVFKINGETSDNQLCVRYQVDNDKYKTFSNAVIISAVTVLSLVILCYLLFDLKFEVLVCLLIITYGLILTVIMSPGANPDEGLHYEATLQVTNRIMGQDIDYIDSAYTNYDSFGDHTNTSYSYNRLLRDFNKPFQLENELYEFNSSIEGNYIGYYLPQSIGVLINRLLGSNMLKIFYSGRLTNLLFYVFCVYIALKNASSHKLMLGVVAVLPIFVQQAASYSYDASVNGLILISASYLFKWMKQEDNISKKDFITVFVTCMLLAPAKVIYGLFSLLYFFVPAEKFGSKKKKTICVLLLCLPSMALIIYNILIRTVDQIANLLNGFSDNTNLLSAGEDEAPLAKFYTVSYMIEHPVETIMIYLRSIRMWISTWFYQSLGRGLAGVSLILPMTVIRVILVLIFVAVLSCDNYTMSGKMRIATLLVCVVSAFLVLTAMLNGWTRRDDLYIQGMQGRYFCPLLPYFFAIFSNKKIKINHYLEKPIVFVIVGIMFFVTVYIMSYTFVN